MANDIIVKQNDPVLIKLLRASTVAYTKAKYGETKITYFLIFLAIAYPVSYVFSRSELIKLCLFGCSFAVAVIIQIFINIFQGNTSKGAIFKEEFDTKLFNLPWKSTLKKPEYSEISRLSLEYKGSDIRDWYSINLSASISHNISVAVFQHTNSSWDLDLRKIFRNWLIGFLVFYTIVLWIFLIYNNINWKSIFLIHFSILSFYIHFFTLIRGHKSAIEKRREISKYLDKIILEKKNISIVELRDIQDEIYSTRQEPTKVPNFFFKLYQKRMDAISEDYIETVNRSYNS